MMCTQDAGVVNGIVACGPPFVFQAQQGVVALLTALVTLPVLLLPGTSALLAVRPC